MSKELQCGGCGRFKDTPNFPYHVCTGANARRSKKSVMAVFGAIDSAVYFDKVCQYVTPNGSAVIMSAKKYRELLKEDLPNNAISDIDCVEHGDE